MNYKQIELTEHLKQCSRAECGKPIGETFVRVDDRIYCSVECANVEGAFAPEMHEHTHCCSRRIP